MSPSDRRDHDRVAVDLEVKLRRGDAIATASMTNLSLGGFLLRTALPVQLDQRLPVQLGQSAAVEFVLDGDHFVVDAVLLRIVGGGVAFQFVGLESERRNRLAMHLDRIEGRQVAAAQEPVEVGCA